MSRGQAGLFTSVLRGTQSCSRQLLLVLCAIHEAVLYALLRRKLLIVRRVGGALVRRVGGALVCALGCVSHLAAHLLGAPDHHHKTLHVGLYDLRSHLFAYSREVLLRCMQLPHSCSCSDCQ